MYRIRRDEYADAKRLHRRDDEIERVDETERVDLSASEIACAVADEYERASFNASVGWWHDMPSGLRMALDRLEEITRPSALRKVRP